MKIPNKTKTPEVDQHINFDALCQGFEGGRFYGLEYILEDFFQNTPIKPSTPAHPGIDWFGLGCTNSQYWLFGQRINSSLSPANNASFTFCKVPVDLEGR